MVMIQQIMQIILNVSVGILVTIGILFFGAYIINELMIMTHEVIKIYKEERKEKENKIK